MNQRRDTSGFTLIEVMLFLAISGLMLSGLLIAISGTINRQRYQDAVYSFQDYMQGQYNLVTNTINDRSTKYQCAPGSGIAPGDSYVGTSDCTIVGRFVTTSDGSSITSVPLYSMSTAYNTTGNEAALLTSMNLGVAPDDDMGEYHDNYTMAWNTLLYADKNNKAASRSFSMLLVRLPTTSVIHTYIVAKSIPTNKLSDIWTGTATTNLCVDSNQLISTGSNGVKVTSQASNSSGIQFIAAGKGVC